MASKRLKIWESAALAALCIALLAGTWAQGRLRGIQGSVVRLHVIAQDDSEAEQALKLRVRDAVLRYLEGRLEDASTRAEAEARIRQELEGIGQAAAAAAEGRAVRVSLSRERYPLRVYEDFRLPAGEYESLRVVIGEGEGRNWWCVVFPPLCLSAAGREEAKSVMAREDFAVVAEDSERSFRFRTVELWGELTGALER